MAVVKTHPAERFQLQSPKRIIGGEIAAKRLEVFPHVGVGETKRVRQTVAVNSLLREFGMFETKAAVVRADGPGSQTQTVIKSLTDFCEEILLFGKPGNTRAQFCILIQRILRLKITDAPFRHESAMLQMLRMQEPAAVICTPKANRVQTHLADGIEHSRDVALRKVPGMSEQAAESQFAFTLGISQN